MLGSVETSNEIQSLLQGACSLRRDIIPWEHNMQWKRGEGERERRKAVT